ncbi:MULTISPECIES: hypothetical protein [unclassified Bradyrhizobium]
MTLDEVVEAALHAFSANRFLLLVERQQIVNLDAPFPLTSKSTVVFLRLTPLKGGYPAPAGADAILRKRGWIAASRVAYDERSDAKPRYCPR